MALAKLLTSQQKPSFLSLGIDSLISLSTASVLAQPGAYPVSLLRFPVGLAPPALHLPPGPLGGWASLAYQPLLKVNSGFSHLSLLGEDHAQL